MDIVTLCYALKPTLVSRVLFESWRSLKNETKVVVIVTHHNSAVNTAVRTITANDPRVRVLEYGSLDYALTMHRVVGRVVWVSHGCDQGILVGNSMLSWQRFSQDIKMTPSRDVVLACYSSELCSYLSPGEAFLFDGPVEATLGALIASFILNGAIKMQSFLTALTSLALGVIQIHFLVLTMEEFAWDTVIFMIDFLLAGAGLYITEGLVMTMYHMTEVLFIDTFIIAGEAVSGELSYLDLIIPLINLMLGIAGLLAILFPGSASLIALDTAILSTPLGVALIVANIAIFIATLYADYLD